MLPLLVEFRLLLKSHAAAAALTHIFSSKRCCSCEAQWAGSFPTRSADAGKTIVFCLLLSDPSARQTLKKGPCDVLLFIGGADWSTVIFAKGSNMKFLCIFFFINSFVVPVFRSVLSI